jgi:hypothetical protein
MDPHHARIASFYEQIPTFLIIKSVAKLAALIARFTTPQAD